MWQQAMNGCERLECWKGITTTQRTDATLNINKHEEKTSADQFFPNGDF
jgi:hypothetical protein